MLTHSLTKALRAYRQSWAQKAMSCGMGLNSLAPLISEMSFLLSGTRLTSLSQTNSRWMCWKYSNRRSASLLDKLLEIADPPTGVRIWNKYHISTIYIRRSLKREGPIGSGIDWSGYCHSYPW